MRGAIGRWGAAAALLVGLWGCDDGEADAGPDATAAGDAGDRDSAVDAGPDSAPPDSAPPDGTPIGDAMPDAVADAIVDAVPEVPPERGPDPDPDLRMNHLQVRGTHNSYHIAKVPTIEEWQYTHLPLAQQLGEQGVRQFELDLHWRPDTEDFAVYHLPFVDELSVCPVFADCLREIDGWLRDNPDEGPVYVLVEPKDDVDDDLVRDHFDALEAEIRTHIAPWRHITPDEVRGEHPDLRTAVLTDGWPSLHAARGRVMFVLLDGSESRDAYVDPDPVLVGRAMFPQGGPEHPWSGFMLRDDAVAEAEGTRQFAAEGYIVRTRADDPETMRIALESGAHMFSTDFPDTLIFEGGAPERCNPVSTPDGCGEP